MYRIGLFSEITKTTIKTLRYYDEIGLLKPTEIDTFTGYRYYSTDQIFRIYEIISYRQIGLSIKQIKEIVLGNKSIEDVLNEKKIELIDTKNETEKQLSQINYLLKERKEGFIMNYKPVVKELPECIVYSKEMNVKNLDGYFAVIPEIGEEVAKANPTLKCIIPDYNFTRYLDGEYKETDIHLEYCQAVDKIGKETESIKFKKIERAKAVCVMHQGAYTTLNKAYAYLVKWCEENNYKLSDSPRESYIDGIWNKDTEEEWLTEIQFPIESK
ncbi:MAG: MerR family transcriptional regulator [Lachnospiraceae bacterium]|jgi:DNA-binding transcriptional MerR regulator|nr:MerR family transcriptional regulator [Lachnospiraceae bacterium]